MKKFKFLFLIALVATMFIGCAQPTSEPEAQPTSEPEAQPTDIYEAGLFMENSDGSICLYRKFIFQNDQYELQLSGETNSNGSLYSAEISISGDKLSLKPVNNNGSGNLYLYNTSVIIYNILAQNWHEIVDKCYKKL